MADINFGILDTQLPGRIAAIPQEAQKQQTANMLQAMQMQKAMREGQMSQMKIDEMLAERKEIDTFAANLKARGYTQGSKGFFTELASSRNPTRMQQGFEGLRRLEEQEKFAVIMGRTRPAAAPVAAAPSVAPEPGSFGADMAARREADPFASRTNMLPGAAAGVNTLAGNAAEIEFKRQQRNDLIGMGTTQSIAAAKALDADIALASREPTYQNVPGVGLVNPRDRSVVMSSVERAPAPPSMVAEYTFAKTPDGGGFRGSYQAFVTARAAAGRTPAQPPAPSTQTIADPTDPTKAIVIDARRYTPGGGIYSPGVIGYAPPAKTPENIREEELKTAYNTNRILNSAVQIGNILKKTPSASQPGGLEASAMAIFGNAGVANLSRSGDRQIVAAAQSDIIDSLLYLATGAAYNKEQLVQQRQSYLPAFTDEPGTVAAKQDALRGLIDGAKVRSGRAWTPKMESAMRSLVGGAPASPPTPAPAAAAKPYSVSTPDGKTHSFDTPAALAAFKTAAGLN